MQKRPIKPRVDSVSTKAGFGGKTNWYRGNTSRGAARKGGQESMREGVQVWSLTQFHSVDFSQSKIDVKSAFSTNAQSRSASVVVDGVLGPPGLARHT